MNKKTNIIFKGKHQKHEHHGSHGVWKIAYADFMTALMAFFLMMWLTSSLPEDIRKGMANYFAPVGASANITGTASILEGGESLDTLGSLDKMKLEQSIFSPVTNYNSSSKKSLDQEERIIKNEGVNQESSPENDEKKEQRILEEAQKTLKESIESSPILKQISENILINITPEGLKIELIDKNGKNMFAIGSTQMLDGMKVALAQIAKVIQVLPNRVNITGHTDARPYGVNASYNNWDLSIDRALESRRFLAASGFPEMKIAAVVGKASNELLDPQSPFSPSNRRISILVLRNAPLEDGKKK